MIFQGILDSGIAIVVLFITRSNTDTNIILEITVYFMENFMNTDSSVLELEPGITSNSKLMKKFESFLIKLEGDDEINDKDLMKLVNLVILLKHYGAENPTISELCNAMSNNINQCQGHADLLKHIIYYIRKALLLIKFMLETNIDVQSNYLLDDFSIVHNEVQEIINKRSSIN